MYFFIEPNQTPEEAFDNLKSFYRFLKIKDFHRPNLKLEKRGVKKRSSSSRKMHSPKKISPQDFRTILLYCNSKFRNEFHKLLVELGNYTELASNKVAEFEWRWGVYVKTPTDYPALAFTNIEKLTHEEQKRILRKEIVNRAFEGKFVVVPRGGYLLQSRPLSAVVFQAPIWKVKTDSLYDFIPEIPFFVNTSFDMKDVLAAFRDQIRILYDYTPLHFSDTSTKAIKLRNDHLIEDLDFLVKYVHLKRTIPEILGLKKPYDQRGSAITNKENLLRSVKDYCLPRSEARYMKQKLSKTGFRDFIFDSNFETPIYQKGRRKKLSK